MIAFLKKILNLWRALGRKMQIVVTAIILMVVYVVGIGITSIAIKLFGKDLLGYKRYKKDSSTTWTPGEEKPIDISNMGKQF